VVHVSIRPQCPKRHRVHHVGGAHAQGARGVVLRTFLFELWPAMLIVTFHQVWWGPGVWLTIYGLAQLIKVMISMLWPAVGLRSMNLACGDTRMFRLGGILLLSIAARPARRWSGR
jgi:hypothetical protein